MQPVVIANVYSPAVTITDLYINKLDPLSALLKATPSNSPLLPSMHCVGNFVLEFPSINSPILTLTHARTTKLVVSATVRIGEFMLGNSRMKLPDAMHAGQERSVRRGCGLAASAAPVVRMNATRRHSVLTRRDVY